MLLCGQIAATVCSLLSGDRRTISTTARHQNQRYGVDTVIGNDCVL
jgi:hypothetical protein